MLDCSQEPRALNVLACRSTIQRPNTRERHCMLYFESPSRELSNNDKGLTYSKSFPSAASAKWHGRPARDSFLTFTRKMRVPQRRVPPVILSYFPRKMCAPHSVRP